MVSNKTLILKKIPVGLPVPGQDLVIEDRPFNLDEAPPAGGIVAEVLYASFDPYLRGKMRDPSAKSYSPAFEVGQPIVNDAIARVLASDTATVKPGDLVQIYVPIAEYVRVPGDAPQNRGLPAIRRIDNPCGFDPAYFLGPLGMPGLTAYAGLLQIGQPKAGETIFVSSAAGAVGQVVGQVAKQLGLRVIGSVGSDEKLAFITQELGFDAGFNYKKESPIDALPRLAPNGVDIYFENVGGDHIEAAIQNMNLHGRIAVCGTVSFLLMILPSCILLCFGIQPADYQDLRLQ